MVESIKILHSEMLHMQVRDQLSVLNDESKGNTNKLLEEGRFLVLDMQGDPLILLEEGSCCS